MRFTPAVKYGGRENRLCARAARCMSGHPCRAHHKLKWARKGQSGLGVLYELIPRSESSNAISAENSVALQCFAACPNSNGSTLSDRGWQQPLNCHKAPPVCRVKDAAGTAKPLVLDSVRWLGYLAAHIHNLPLIPPARTNFPSCPLLYRRFIVFYTYTQNER